MMHYKAMTTPMASNLKLLSVSSSERIDTMMYHQIIGSLLYLMNTIPDNFFAMNTLRHVHLIASNHILRYMRGTIDYGLKYEVNQKINLEGYEDLYWVGSAIDRKRTSR